MNFIFEKFQIDIMKTKKKYTQAEINWFETVLWNK